MADRNIILPTDHFTLVKGQDDGQLVTILINDALAQFEDRDIFPWHLSILFSLPHRDSGRPDDTELKGLNDYEDSLIEGLRSSSERPNALYLSTRTGNNVRCTKFQVHDPEVANSFLQQVCEKNDTPYPMGYKMHHDDEWTDARGFFGLLSSPNA